MKRSRGRPKKVCTIDVPAIAKLTTLSPDEIVRRHEEGEFSFDDFESIMSFVFRHCRREFCDDMISTWQKRHMVTNVREKMAAKREEKARAKTKAAKLKSR